MQFLQYLIISYYSCCKECFISFLCVLYENVNILLLVLILSFSVKEKRCDFSDLLQPSNFWELNSFRGVSIFKSTASCDFACAFSWKTWFGPALSIIP